MNKIRENPVPHPQTAAKNKASEAGMINYGCAFGLRKPFFIIILLILTVSLKTHWRITGISAWAAERLQLTICCPAGFVYSDLTQWYLHADARHVGV